MALGHPRPAIGLYLLLVFAFSAVFYALVIATGHLGGGFRMYVAGLMWCPAMAALASCRLGGQPLAGLGWHWSAARWAWLAYLLPLGYAAVAYAIVWLGGLGGFGNPQFVASLAEGLGWGAAPSWLVVAGYFLLRASVGLVFGLSTALGEEIGWRGYLAPRMTEAFGFTRGALLTGAVWALWHMPILLFADYNSGTPWWFALPCFTLMVLAISVPMAWLRLRSGSLWPAAILHASHNVFIQQFFTPITSPHGAITPYAIDEFGFMLPLVVVLVAVVVWRRRGQLGERGADYPHRAGTDEARPG
ncbi:type II CAAX endopeptidase family protein [Frateuria defendens]|uniref:type II CAAX endopeptidase family protein n=1 Tax=Frateuria defendens TaxID=2219559 RepID=UPI00066FDA27|nr:type II CAAX endopeptidase family protein [Frateuria defendens]